jgi:uncharacterized membrane protein
MKHVICDLLLLSLRIRFIRLIHVIACIGISFLFIAE